MDVKLAFGTDLLPQGLQQQVQKNGDHVVHTGIESSHKTSIEWYQVHPGAELGRQRRRRRRRRRQWIHHTCVINNYWAEKYNVLLESKRSKRDTTTQGLTNGFFMVLYVTLHFSSVGSIT